MRKAACALFLCLLVGGVSIVVGMGLLVAGLSGTLAFHKGIRTALSPMEAPYYKPADLEVEAARRIPADGTQGPRKRWGRPEIEAFIAESQGLNQKELSELASAIDEECRAYGFAPRFVLSVIAVESAFTPKSVSSKGAMGLMQLRPFVAEAVARQVDLPWKGKEILYRPATNVQLGMHYLFELTLRYRDLSLALAAYNMGPTRLDGILSRAKDPPSRYVKKVIQFYRSL